MASIKTSIELYDNFSAPMMDVVAAANAGVSAINNVQAAMSGNVDTSGISRASEAVQALDDALRRIEPPSLTTEGALDLPDTGTQEEIRIPVRAVVTGVPEVDVPDGIRVDVTPVVDHQPQIDVPEGIEVPVTPRVTEQPVIATPEPITVPVTPQVTNQIELDTPESVEISVTPIITNQPQVDVPDEVTVPVTPVVTQQPQINIPEGIEVPVRAEVTEQPVIDTPDRIVVPVDPVVTEQPVIDVPDRIEVPVTPVVDHQPQIDVPEGIEVPITLQVTGEERIEEITNRLADMTEMQRYISSVGRSLYVLPQDSASEISGINRELSRMQAALDFLRTNPFELNSDIAELQIQGLSDALDALIIRQQQLDNLMGNAPSQARRVDATPSAPPQRTEENPAPVEVPFEWQADNMNVFQNTGVERFQQEVESANRMLQELSSTQSEITTKAQSMSILPSEAQNDIQNLQNRIENLQNSIQSIEETSLDVGTDEANSQVEQLRSQLSSLLGTQENLNAAMQSMDLEEINSAYLNLSQSVGNMERNIRDSFATPVEVPITWETDGLDIFTGTGIERFQQEVESTNSMLSTLRETQSRITAAAGNMNIIPEGMISDLASVGSRMDAIQTRIQAIANNPLNIGSEDANRELEQLRSTLNSMIQDQEALNRAVADMDVFAANDAYLRLSRTVGSTERYIRDNTDEQGNFNRSIHEGTGEASDLMSTIKGAIAAYATIQTVGNVLNLSDQLTSTTARLDLMNDGLQSTQDLQNMIYLSAQRSRGAYQSTADAVSKLGLMAGDAFSSSSEIIAFTEQLNKNFTIAGTEASGIDAAMLQLTQAMGSGVLRGEEYNSILEQAPNIIQNISKYIEGNENVLESVASAMDMTVDELSGNVKGNLKDIASEGLISAEMVKAAMFYTAEETNAKFESMPKTFEQIWTSFQNTALVAFQPVLNKLNEIANSDAFQTLVNTAITGVATLAGAATQVLNLVVSIGGAVAANWSIISPIIYGIIAALAIYYGKLLAVNALEAVSKAIKIASTLATYAYAAATGVQVSETVKATAAQLHLNTALLACPITWVIALVIALVAVFYAAVAAVNKFAGTSISATGIVAGAFATLGAVIYNAFALAWNIVMAVVEFLVNVWTEPEYSAKAFLVNVGQAFLGFLSSIVSGTQEAVGLVVGLFFALGQGALNVFALIVNFGIDAITDFVNSWNSGVYEVKSAVVALGTLFLDFLINCIENNASAIGTFIGAWYVFKAAAYNVIAFIVNTFIQFVSNIVNLWQDGTYEIRKAFISIGTMVLKVAESILSTMGGLVSNVINGIIGGVNKALSGLNSVIDTVNMIPGVSIGHIGEMSEVNLDFGASALKGVQDDLNAWLGDEPTPWVAPWDEWETKDLSEAFAEGQAKADELVSNAVSSLEDAKSSLQDWLGDEPEQWDAPWDKWETKDIGEAFEEGKNIGIDAVSNMEDWINNASAAMDDWLGPKPENYWDAPTLDYIDLSDAAKAGYDFGKGVEDKISGFDPSNLFDTNIPNPEDYADLSNFGGDIGNIGGIGNGLEDIGDGVDGIGNDTSKIADSVDVTSEELKYLRDIAERETINRFTTAEIKIEQTNNNSVSSEMDLDGIVDGLTDAVNEAVEIIAEGEHE